MTKDENGKKMNYLSNKFKQKTSGKNEKKSKKEKDEKRSLAEVSADESDSDTSYYCAGGCSTGNKHYETNNKPETKTPTFAEVAKGAKSTRPSLVSGASSEPKLDPYNIPAEPNHPRQTPRNSSVGVAQSMSWDERKGSERADGGILSVDEMGKFRIGSRVKMVRYQERGYVRWLAYDKIGKAIAGLEMDRNSRYWSCPYEEKSWFTCTTGHEHYDVVDALELLDRPSKDTKSDAQAAASGTTATDPLRSNGITENTISDDGKFYIGARVKTRLLHDTGTVRWIGFSGRLEYIGVQMDEKTYGSGSLHGHHFFDCPKGFSQYLSPERLEVLPPTRYADYDDYASVHRGFVPSRRAGSVPLVSVLLESGGFKCHDTVIYDFEHPGTIVFIGESALDPGQVYVSLDLSEKNLRHLDEKVEGMPFYESKEGTAITCSIHKISRLEDVPKRDHHSFDKDQYSSRSTGTIPEVPEDSPPDNKTTEFTNERMDAETYDNVPPTDHTRRSRPDTKLNNSYTDRPSTSRYPLEKQNRVVNDHTDIKGRPALREKTLKDVSKVTVVHKPYMGLEVNAMVETTGQKTIYGVIKWMGWLPEDGASGCPPLVGIEMEDEVAAKTEHEQGCRQGNYDGYRLFDCKSGRGNFFRADKLRKDGRFENFDTAQEVRDTYDMPQSAVVAEDQAPPVYADEITGRFKGIQGHHNSCYLDATLYSMFAFTHVFDSVLHRPLMENSDIRQYVDVQEILRQKIVNPLRRDHYVQAEKVLELREILDRLTTVSGMMGEEKDPEEFLNSLLQETLKADPFIKLSSGQASFLYQLFMEKDEHIKQPTVQELLLMSFQQAKIKLKETPPCLILQMPRFGRVYKMFDRIIPSPQIDISKILEGDAPSCDNCFSDRSVDWHACEECSEQKSDIIILCHSCLRTHQKSKRSQGHTMYEVPGRQDRHVMELFSVVCIETSHYVAFTKCGPNGEWVFFDSMADRMGDQHGFNIPEVIPCPDIADTATLLANKTDPLVRRVLCDAYMCFYRSPMASIYQ